MSLGRFRDFTWDCEEVTNYRKLKRGDHIAVEGELAGIQYYHHGIFLGNGDVADFGGANKKEAKPRIVKLTIFTDSRRRRLVLIIYPEGACLSPEKVAETAEQFVKKPNTVGSYSLVRNNCEHFATQCKTGVAFSKQVIEKLRECLSNPMSAVRYVVTTSGASDSGPFGTY